LVVAAVLFASGSLKTSAGTQVDPAESTARAAPDYVPADGLSAATITVTLRDSRGNPVSGIPAYLDFSQQTGTLSNPGGPVSDAHGEVIFKLTSTTPGDNVFHAGGSFFQSQTMFVTFTPVNVSTTAAAPANSSVVVSPGSVPADGSSLATITVTLRDSSGNPVQGKRMRLVDTANRPGAVPANPSGPFSDAAGVVTYTLSSAHVGSRAFRIADMTDNVSLGFALVTFEPKRKPAVTVAATPKPHNVSTFATPSPAADENGWSANAIKYRGRNGQHFAFACPAGGPPFAVGGDNFSGVYGTDIYTDDSSVCLAAVHAGLIFLKAGGEVTIEIRPRADSYIGSTRNGITTIDYGTCECGSYVFASAAP